MTCSSVLGPGRLSRMLAVLLAGCLILGCQPPESKDEQGDETAMSTAECIAPADPGGGYDFTCRSAARVLTELGLVERNVRTINMPGGGGGVAFAHTLTQRKNADDVLVAASMGGVLHLAQGHYGEFDHNDVRWLAAIGSDYGVIAVNADSPYRSLDDLVEAWQEDPSRATAGGGSAIGGQDHMKILLMAQAAEGLAPGDIRYVPFDGGGEALTSLLGGFIDVMTGDVSDVVGQLEAGNIRILAVLSAEESAVAAGEDDRLSGDLATIATAREQGYDVQWTVFRGFYVPPGISDPTYQWWLDTMTEVEGSDQWAKIRRQNHLQPFFLAGDEFKAYVDEQINRMKKLSREVGLADRLPADTTQ